MVFPPKSGSQAKVERVYKSKKKQQSLQVIETEIILDD